jgi:hypothetical protein
VGLLTLRCYLRIGITKDEGKAFSIMGSLSMGMQKCTKNGNEKCTTR